MAKRFFEPDWKVLRKLNPRLREAWFYCWDKADAIGVYEYDAGYMIADLGFTVPPEDLLKLPNAEKISAEKILFNDFIAINYTQLKEGYNPHKPAFRALQKNNLKLNSSLNQACSKLEDEEEDEEEDKDEEEGEDRGGAGGDSEPESKADIILSNQVQFVISDLNSKAGTEYRPSSKKTRELIRARIREGFTLSDFEHVNTVKCLEWLNTEQEKFIRPETLYGTKFESYKNQRVQPPASKKGGGGSTFDRGTVEDGLRTHFAPQQ